MNDQAALLRRMMANAVPREPVPEGPPGPPTVVIGSGKGGVGKSVLSALLASRVAGAGRRVLLVDGSQNLGNLHVLLGCRRAARLEHLLGEGATPDDLLVPVTDRLMLLPADSGAEGLYALGSLDRARLHHRLSGLYDGFDAVIVDAGPGLESVVRVATMRASRLVVVTVPEPAALTDAYATIKIVNLQVADLPVDVLVNRVVDPAEGPAAFERLATAAQRFLQRELRYLGALREDDGIRRAVRTPGALTGAVTDSLNDESLAAVIERLDLAAPARVAG